MFFATEALDVKSNFFFSLWSIYFSSPKNWKKVWEVDYSSNLWRLKATSLEEGSKTRTFDWFFNLFSNAFTITTKNWERNQKIIKLPVDFFSPQNTLKICWKANQHKKQLLFHVFHRRLYCREIDENHIGWNLRPCTFQKQSQLIGKCGTDLHSIYIVD